MTLFFIYLLKPSKFPLFHATILLFYLKTSDFHCFNCTGLTSLLKQLMNIAIGKSTYQNAKFN